VKKPTDIGSNRTGIKTSPIDGRRTVEGAEEDTTAAPAAGATIIQTERVLWSRDVDPVGTVPPPATVTGVAKTTVQMARGHRPNVLIDKLGERIAFERTGVRLYEALLAKLAAADVHQGGPTRDELERIRDDELRHFALVKDAMESLGGDPTAMTPCADIVMVASGGLIQVVTDPRTTLAQALDAALVAELTDNDGWAMLIDLADGLGQDEMVASFREALIEEEDHLVRVRGWLTASLRGQAGVAPTPPQPQAGA
jgi:rubrerythrin